MSNDNATLERLWKLQTKVNMMILDDKREAKPLADFLQEFMSPTPKWRKEGDRVYLSVVSDGTTGREWIQRLADKGYPVTKYAEEVLSSRDFGPTSGRKYEIVILLSGMFGNEDRTTQNIRARAKKLGYLTPSAELACLLREKLSNQDIFDMGICSIATMHKPIRDLGGVHDLLCVECDHQPFGFSADERLPHIQWGPQNGFAFVVPPPHHICIAR